ncbi:MAG: MFS transporter [Candidatus Omnitrophota bacterium]
MFSSLKVKNFRVYWFGMLISLVGTWIQVTAQSWLVFQLTNSVFLLGLVAFLGSAPIFLLSLFGGVVADRVDKKKILLCTQCAFMLLAFALAILTQFKLITPLQIMAIAVLNGVVMSFDAPSRQSVVVELVGKDNLLNAIALSSAAFNSSRMIGPALAGIFIATIGMSGCFYLNAISFLAPIIALLMIKINAGSAKRENKGVLVHDLMEGLRFISSHRIMLILVLMVGITSFFGVSYATFMPVFANDILKVGAKGLGMLMSVTGVGALIAALGLARLGDFKHKGRLLILSAMVFSVSLVLFASSRSYLLSLAALMLLGWASITAISLINTVLQQLVPDEFRGRLMSVYMFTFAGFMPFGNLLAGALAYSWGVPLTVMLSGIICTAFFVAITIFYPEIKNI